MNSRKPLKNRTRPLLALVAIFFLCSNLPGQVSQFPPSYRPQPGAKVEQTFVLKLRVEEDKVTADISNTPMQTVLAELAERSGVIFEVRNLDNPFISIHVNRIPLQEFIQRITSGSNAIFNYAKGADPERITLVRLYPRMVQLQQPGIVYLGSGVVTKTNNAVETPEQALQAVTGNASLEDRELAIEILVKAKGDAAVKALIDCISDPAPEIRVAAIEGLSSMGVREALPGILKSLKDTHPGVRQSAVSAVAFLGNAGNIKDLKPLSLDKDPGIAAAAEIAIRKLSSIEKK
jgi:hypothetical protein